MDLVKTDKQPDHWVKMALDFNPLAKASRKISTKKELMEIPDSITCVDCLQVARLMTLPSEDGWQPGDIVAYRCTGCNDRWDMVVDDDHGSESQHPFPQDAAVIREFLDGRRGQG